MHTLTTSNLDAVETSGVFDHAHDATDRLWVGFALGLRCAQRRGHSADPATAQPTEKTS